MIKTNDHPSIIAVVVTYNRKELLQGCLKALTAQSRPLKGIVLVDNASTDNTLEFLIESAYITKYPSKEFNNVWEETNQLFEHNLSGNFIFIMCAFLV